MKTTIVYNKNGRAKTRYVLNPGGTRSSKTTSLMQIAYGIAWNLQDKPITISVASETMPHLKRGAM